MTNRVLSFSYELSSLYLEETQAHFRVKNKDADKWKCSWK